MKSALYHRINELEDRLAETEGTLAAIRTGKVDAIMVLTPKGERVFTLRGADRPYRVMVEQMAEGAATFTREGTILFCNQRIADLLGVPLENLLGSRIFEYLPFRDRPLFELALQNIKGKPARFEAVLLRKSKRPFPASISLAALNLDDREGAYCMVVNDLTERQRLERQVLEVSEREQQRLGQDLHDGLGQALSGIAYLLQDILHSSEEQKRTAKVERVSELVNHALTQTRELAKGFYPVELERNGLHPALNELSSQMETTFQVRCRVQCDSCIDHIPAEAQIHLYRIIQESIRNAIHHGRARMINVEAVRHGEDAAITIRNNGSLFPTEPMPLTLANATGMGLKIMHYRASLIGASLRISPGRKRGCSIVCSVPLDKSVRSAST